MTQAQDLINDFNAEAEKSRLLLAAVPEDKLDWKPHDKSFSLAQLAGHIAETPTWVGSMIEDSWDCANMVDYVPQLPSSSAELMAAFEKGLASVPSALEGRDDEFMAGTWRMTKGDQVLMEETRAEAMRSYLIHHIAHHRGQLSVYLRLLDVPVPATFGDSADFPMF